MASQVFYASRDDTNSPRIRFWLTRPQYNKRKKQWHCASRDAVGSGHADTFREMLGWQPKRGKCEEIESTW